MKLEKFDVDPRRRPFFLEITTILEEKVQNLAMIPSDDLFFFLENTRILGRKA